MTSVDWKVLSKQYQRPGGAGASHVYAISNKQLVDEIAVRGGGSRDEKEKKEELCKVLCKLRRRDFNKGEAAPDVPGILSVAEASAIALKCPLLTLEPWLTSMLGDVDAKAAALDDDSSTSSEGPGAGGGGREMESEGGESDGERQHDAILPAIRRGFRNLKS